jgi:CBS domain-containing protein
LITAKDLISKDYLAVDAGETVSKLIGKMKRKNTTFALVFQGKKYKGLIDKRFLLTSRVDTSKMKITNVIKKRSKSKTPFYVPKLETDTDLDKMCRLLATTNTRALPVIKKNQIIGVVTVNRILKELKKSYKGVKADELASKKLITADEKEPIGKVIEKMHLQGTDRMPVIDKLKKLVGIATLNDIMKYFQRWPISSQKIRGGNVPGYPNRDSGEKQDMLKAPIRNIMIPTRMCYTAGPKEPVPRIIDMMAKENVCSIILESKLKPIGMITVRDILRDYSR